MVASLRRSAIIVLFLATLFLAILTTVHAGADGILAQMQREIVDIATRTRSAVVTVEDARALVTAYDNSPLAKKEIEGKVALRAEEKQISDSEFALVQQRLKAGSISQSEFELARVKNQRAAMLLEIEQHKLKLLGTLSQAEQERQDAIDQISLLQIDKHGLDIQISLLEDMKHSGEADNQQLVKARGDRRQVEQRLSRLNRNFNETVRDKILEKDPHQITNDLNSAALDPSGGPPRSGTGFSIGDGYIVTTADVLQGMQSPVVVTDTGDKLRADLVGLDNDLNIGLVKLQTTLIIPALRLGDSDQVMPGFFAISIGNQNGQTNAISLNLVSGVLKSGSYGSRFVHFYPSLIEIGGTIGAGASGSPLVDIKGDVIGILVAIPFTPPLVHSNPTQSPNSGALESAMSEVSAPINYQATPSPVAGEGLQTQQTDPIETFGGFLYVGDQEAGGAPPHGKPDRSEGSPNALPTPSAKNHFDSAYKDRGSKPAVDYQPFALTPAVSSAGYAVPINVLKPVIEELRGGHSVKRSWIGIATTDQEQASEKDGIIHIDHTVKVSGVYPDSPAQKEGILPGDQLLTLGDTPIHATADVRNVVVRLRDGQTLKACVKRNGEVKNYLLSIQPKPESPKPPITEPIKSSF